MAKTRKTQIPTGFEEISPRDIKALEVFLTSGPLAKRAMSLPMFDGLLTAAIIGPEPVMPSDYLPWLWDWERGKKDVVFASEAEANRIMGYVMKMHNRVAGLLDSKTPLVMPVFILDPAWSHREWLTGFLMGADFDAQIWDYAREVIPEVFEPLRVISVMKPDDPGWDDACTDLSASLVTIRDFFREGEWREAFEEVPQPVVREGPKVGRNDPCPCGSGRKYKKCCGETGGVVH